MRLTSAYFSLFYLLATHSSTRWCRGSQGSLSRGYFADALAHYERAATGALAVGTDGTCAAAAAAAATATAATAAAAGAGGQAAVAGGGEAAEEQRLLASEVQRKVAWAHDRLGDTELAHAAFSRAIQVDPTNIVAVMNRGRLVGEHFPQRTAEALSDFKTAVRLDPTHAMARNNVRMAERMMAQMGM